LPLLALSMCPLLIDASKSFPDTRSVPLIATCW
jgi:hypothetical protein